MAKEIIPYNLRDDVKEGHYAKWCEHYKGPLPIGPPGSKSLALLKMMGKYGGMAKKSACQVQQSLRSIALAFLDAPSLEREQSP